MQPFFEAYKSGYLKKFSRYKDQLKEAGSNCFLFLKKKWSVRQTFTFRDLCVPHKQCLGITLVKEVLSIVVLPSVAEKYEDLEELCSSHIIYPLSTFCSFFAFIIYISISVTALILQ